MIKTPKPLFSTYHNTWGVNKHAKVLNLINMPAMDPLPFTVYRPSQGHIAVIWFQVWTHTWLPFTGPDSAPNQQLIYNTWPRASWPDLVQRRKFYDMSITQRYHPWYVVGQFGVPHVWVSVVSTQVNILYPAPIMLLHSFQYSYTGKGLLITAMENSGLVHIF